jgi:hypothetical protein
MARIMNPTPAHQAPGRAAVWRSRLWTALIVVGPVLCFLVVVLVHFRSGSVTVCDPRFQFLGQKITTGTDRVLYFDGNQMLCRANRWLKRSMGLDLNPWLRRITGQNLLDRGWIDLESSPTTHWFLIRYRVQRDPDELGDLEAFLTAPDGLSMELRGGGSNVSTRAFIGSYRLMQALTNTGPYSLVLKIRSTGKTVATWRIASLH